MLGSGRPVQHSEKDQGHAIRAMPMRSGCSQNFADYLPRQLTCVVAPRAGPSRRFARRDGDWCGGPCPQDLRLCVTPLLATARNLPLLAARRAAVAGWW
jgi:hypothetical protein